MNRSIYVSIFTLLPLTIGACERQPESTPTPKRSGSGTPAPQTPPPATAPHSPTPASSAPAVAGGGALTVNGVAFSIPEGWKQMPPANQMRLAEILVNDGGGDATKSCNVVFSTAGGDVQSNVTRWAGQMRDASGQGAKADIKTREVGGFKVHTVEFKGAFQGMGDAAPRNDWMMRGAIIETSGGLLFVKMTGPASVMETAGAGWTALIDGAHKP